MKLFNKCSLEIFARYSSEIFHEIIPSKLGENFGISFATFGAISELHSEKNSEVHL
jgi:hypothetical protein